MDKDLKPESATRDQLDRILQYPPTQLLTQAEKDLIWRFRYHLTREKRALVKFLKSVTWSDRAEARQATDILLPTWIKIDVDDALELLGPSFTDSKVRSYAVAQLANADDDVSPLRLISSY